MTNVISRQTSWHNNWHSHKGCNAHMKMPCTMNRPTDSPFCDRRHCHHEHIHREWWFFVESNSPSIN